MSRTRPRILVQIDADDHASVFDAVVAIDAGIDHWGQDHRQTRAQQKADQTDDKKAGQHDGIN